MIIPAYKKSFVKLELGFVFRKKETEIHLAGVFSIEKATRIFAYNILNTNHLLAIQLKQGRVHIKQSIPLLKNICTKCLCVGTFFHMSQDSWSKMVNFLFFFFFVFYHIEEKLQALKSNTLILSH